VEAFLNHYRDTGAPGHQVFSDLIMGASAEQKTVTVLFCPFCRLKKAPAINKPSRFSGCSL
jgi:hypothetical protein